ncbi:MAG: hypothetical protein BroJett040_09490 [Oligoflexia bacterium]|nr:MAG: hypothetical protein BroJett040_09490 [Oligoflexia bacterium]
MNTINKLDKIHDKIIQITIYMFPVALAAIALDYLGYNDRSDGKTIMHYLFDICGWGIVIWTTAVIYLFFAIAINKNLKNKVVRKLAGISENDEREAQITGVASKKTFITATGAMILLVFLSALNIVVYKYPQSLRTEGKNGAILIGMSLKLVEDKPMETTQAAEDGKIYIINYKGLPLTGAGMLILIFIIQIGGFYYFSKKESAVG